MVRCLLILRNICNILNMTHAKITVQATVKAPLNLVWDSYTSPKHIINWNFADPSWHCPSAKNDMRVGGTYSARMESKDGSFGFDFDAVYTEISDQNHFTYEFGGRYATVTFNQINDETTVVVTFDPENENPVELQQTGWQMILNNFKAYTETLP